MYKIDRREGGGGRGAEGEVGIAGMGGTPKIVLRKLTPFQIINLVVIKQIWRMFRK